MAISTNEIAQRLFKKLLGKGDTSTNRAFYEEAYNGSLQVFSNNVWTDTSKIPTVFLPTFRTLSGSTVQNLINDSYVYPDGTTGLTQSNAVVQVKTYTLTKDNGSNTTTPDSQGFAFVNPSATDIIPFTYGNPYSYYITYNSGSVLSFGSGDSVFDPESGILKFYTANIPSDWDGSSSFVIKAGKYIGNKLSSYDLSEINNKLNISTFTAYTATTKTQIDSKVDYSTFTGYTATTNTRINNKVETSTYNTFVSNTNDSISTINNNTVFTPGNGLNSTIRCGLGNNASCDNSSILGGCNNQVIGVQSTIVGGQDNRIEGPSCYSFIGGGVSNFSEHENTFILGSSITTTTPDTTYVQGLNIKNGVYDGNSSLGGSGNILSSTGTGVRWGSTDNLISGSTSVTSKLNISDFSSYSSNTNTLIGTKLDISDFSSYSSNTNTLIGAKLNITTFNTYTSNTNTLIGTKLNTSTFSTYTAQTNSRLLFSSNTIGSTFRIGSDNLSSGCYSTISGGQCNSTVSGGGFISDYSTVGGGQCNNSVGNYSTIGGGASNNAVNIYSTVGGGSGNVSRGTGSFVGGGVSNVLTLNSNYSSILGGFSNCVDGIRSTVIGGVSNVAEGCYSSIIGGEGNKICQSPKSGVTFTTILNGCCNTSYGYSNLLNNGISNLVSGNYNNVGGNSNITYGNSLSVNGTSNVVSNNIMSINTVVSNTNPFIPRNLLTVTGITYSPLSYWEAENTFNYDSLLGYVTQRVDLNYSAISSSAMFNVSRASDSPIVVTVNSSGNNFFVGDQITISGTTLGVPYTSPQDDLIFYVDSVEFTTVPAKIFISGDKRSGYSVNDVIRFYNNSEDKTYTLSVNISGTTYDIGTNLTTVFISSNLNTNIGVSSSGLLTNISTLSTGTTSSIIGGGKFNIITDSYSIIGGGCINTLLGCYSTISNGVCNTVTGNYSTINGGISNKITGVTSSIVGGQYNKILCNNSIIGGGVSNTTEGNYSSILGGQANKSSVDYSIILGGQYNTVSGTRSGILGNNNTIRDSDTYIVGSNISSDRNCTTFVNNLSIMNIPTSPTGLPSGSVWSNGGILTIV
jgi:hypothetical protein